MRDPLEARCASLGDSFDLLAGYRPTVGFFFERDGVGVAGAAGLRTFSAARIGDLVHVVDVLRGILRRGSGLPPIAAGGIAFAGSRAGRPAHELIITRRSVRKKLDGAWRLDLGVVGQDDGDPPPFERVGGATPSEAFTELQVREHPSAADYGRAVERAVGSIQLGELRKVVLARTMEVEADRVLDPRTLAHRLRAVNPHAHTFAVPSADGVLVGASPELLVSRFGREVRSNPLAGSAPRSGDPGEDRANAEALRTSAKNLEEHAIVVEAIAETLGPFCEELGWDPEPVVLATPNVWHLSTRFEGVLREPAPNALELVAGLHPTPAVGGEPTAEALRLIDELEPFDRGSYAGPVGWVDADGDGEWAIALRCAELTGSRATLYAGAGIVAESQPQLEIDETDRKFRAFLDALRWG